MPVFSRSWSGSLLILLLALGPMALLGQPAPGAPATTPTLDTSRAGKNLAPTASGDRTGNPAQAGQDSLATPKSRADTVLVVRHSFNHRQQIITGSVVMTCLALMMVIMNNYNPR